MVITEDYAKIVWSKVENKDVKKDYTIMDKYEEVKA